MAFESVHARLKAISTGRRIDKADDREYRGSLMPEPKWALAKRRVPRVDTCLGKVGEKEPLSIRDAFAIAGHLATCEKVVDVIPGGLESKRRAAAFRAVRQAGVLYPGHNRGEAGTCMVVVEPRRWTR
jgi:hypothetical protein